jgi:hypothetical protein
MSTEIATDGGSPFGFLRSALFVRLAALVVGLILVGYFAPILLGANPGRDEFVGIIVGMAWSLAALIITVSLLVWALSSVRQALR